VEDKTIILPKNSGLEDFRKQVGSLPNQKIIVRGEDVAFFVDKMCKKGTNCVGLTGQDLLKEYKLKNPLSSVQEIKNLGWKDKESIFGKPALCLLGPQGKELKKLDQAKQSFAGPANSKVCLDTSFGNLKVAINSKYRAIADNYLGKLVQKGYSFEKYYLTGATEQAATTGIVDLVIDIVSSGASAREAGLRVYDRIIESDAILVGVRE
jgi:ATP phosphoribosyltransferase